MGRLKRKTQLLVLLAIALALLIVVYPNPSSFFNSQSNVEVGFVVTYSDGTVKIYEGTNQIPLQVVDPTTGKTISQIYCTVRITPTWIGIRSSNLVTGIVTITNNGVTKYTGSPTNPVLSSGVSTIVYVRYIYNAELNTWAPTPGSYTLVVSATITVKVTFTDGSTSSLTNSGSGQIKYSYSG